MVAIAGLLACSSVACSQRATTMRSSGPTAITVVPAVPNFVAPVQREGSGFYRANASTALNKAMEKAAGDVDRGDFDRAIATLDDDTLDRKTGVVVERYTARRIDVPPGSISTQDARRLADSLFDDTYSLGHPGRRGVRMGITVMGGGKDGARSMFVRDDDYAMFQRTRVVSLMETWIRVWQDMVGIQPLSGKTRAYINANNSTRGWSDVDALATMSELGVTIPANVLSNVRFPSWRTFHEWDNVTARR